MHWTSFSAPAERVNFLSRRRDIWELGLELTRLADMEMTEAQREHWRTDDRDLEVKVILSSNQLSIEIEIETNTMYSHSLSRLRTVYSRFF